MPLKGHLTAIVIFEGEILPIVAQHFIDKVFLFNFSRSMMSRFFHISPISLFLSDLVVSRKRESWPIGSVLEVIPFRFIRYLNEENFSEMIARYVRLHWSSSDLLTGCIDWRHSLIYGSMQKSLYFFFLLQSFVLGVSATAIKWCRWA